MRNEVTYEWTVEILDHPDGDIQESIFWDTADDMMRCVVRELEDHTFVTHGVLFRLGNEHDGEVDRAYAYINRDGVLEPTFSNARPVPKYIHAELARAMVLHDAR